jgi:hypothetical protein
VFDAAEVVEVDGEERSNPSEVRRGLPFDELSSAPPGEVLLRAAATFPATKLPFPFELATKAVKFPRK